MPTLYRILDVHPYLDREEEYAGLTLEEAAHRMDDLTGVGADVILADWDEPCDNCRGRGWVRVIEVMHPQKYLRGRCDTCDGDGKRSDPWKFIDEETGREVTMMQEVE